MVILCIASVVVAEEQNYLSAITERVKHTRKPNKKQLPLGTGEQTMNIVILLIISIAAFWGGLLGYIIGRSKR